MSCGKSKYIIKPKRNVPSISKEQRSLTGSTGEIVTTHDVAAVHAPHVNKYRKIKLYSAYLGSVEVDIFDVGYGHVALQTIVKGLDNEPDIFIKEIDVNKNNLQPDRYQYDIRYLAQLPPTLVDIKECKKHYMIIVRLEEKKKKEPLTDSDLKQLHKSYIYNNAVDIHFNTCQYVDFLHKYVKINNVTNTNVLLSMHNVARFDNAFFTGEYMVYGNGDRMFFPLGSSDISGHELGHGVVQSIAGLKYQGHSGALNESFADILGVCFEFFLYTKFNKNEDKTDDIKGDPDWTIGEDCGKALAHLRNMQDPNQANPPQPKKYRGKYWRNPNSAVDHGGVHTNSGVGNYCFYKISKDIGYVRALDIFCECLGMLSPSSSYIDFRDSLMNIRMTRGLSNTINKTLNEVGLNIRAVLDWKQ